MLWETDKINYMMQDVESGLELALEERKELGLSIPENFGVQIEFYTKNKAYAYVEANKNQIVLNSFIIALDSLEGKKLEKARYAKSYFDSVNNLFGNIGSDSMLKFMNEPEKMFSITEFLAGDFEEYKKKLENSGIDYEHSKKEIIRAGASVKNIINEILPDIDYGFLKLYSNHLRHELDHLSFIESPIYKKVENQLMTLKGALKFSEEISEVIEESRFKWTLEHEATQYLKQMAKESSAFETRALFFTLIPLGGLKKADFDSATEEVINYFHQNYLISGSLKHEIIKVLSKVESHEKKISQKTENYLIMNGEPSNLLENPRLEESDRKRAVHIIKNRLPEWTRYFEKTAKIAAAAHGRTFKNNPGLMKEAEESASYFEEYIRCLQK